MAKLIVLTLLGHNGLWISRTLEDNSKELLKNGIEIVPSDKTPGSFVHHSQLWLNSDASDFRFKAIKDKLAQGVNQLILNFICPPSSYENFTKSLLKFDIHHEDIWAGIVISRISTLFEAMGKSPYGQISDSSDFRSIPGVDKILNMIPIILENFAKFGRDNCHIIPDFSDFSSNNIALEIVHKLCSHWGITPGLNIANPIYNNLCYNSATVIRLLNAMSVRNNDWPHINGQPYMNELLQFDKQWRPEPCLPLQMREAIINDVSIQNIQTKLEHICGTQKGSFGYPKWFADSPALGPGIPLDQKKVEDFVNRLTPETSEALLERFFNDRRFLDGDQCLLMEKLIQRNSKNMDFCRLETGAEIPVLTVLTMAHNHEKYIAECMDSVLMQETDFPVQHMVLDHYSTDGTPDIIRAYAQKYPSIRPILLRPGAGVGRSNVSELLGRCQSEYAALCDGDDYFTVPYKLQKQVDFLRNNPKCSLVFHPVEVNFEDGSHPSFFFPSIASLSRGVKKEYFLSDLTKFNMIQTNSVVYRWRFRDGLPEWFRTDLCPGDWYWHLLHAEVGRIGFIREVMSVYRRHANALYSNAFINSIEHRRKTGMAELEAYKAYNAHFNGRYFVRFGNLAAGVLSDFAEIAIKENDTSLLDDATKKYPEFARHFLDVYKRRFDTSSHDK